MSVGSADPAPFQGAFASDAEAQLLFARRERFLLWRRRLLPVAALIAFLVIWQAIIVSFAVKPFIAPSPIAVLQVIGSKADVLAANLATTMLESVLGFLLGNLAATAIAVAFVYRETLEETCFPIAVAFNTIPIVAKAPIIILLLGNGLAPKIAIVALVCFFPTLINMTRGFRDVSNEHMELMRILSASKREIFLKLRTMNALPYLFAALKITASVAVIGAVIGEWISATSGIGAMIVQATVHYETPTLYAAVVVGSAFAAAFFGVVSWAERKALAWRVESSR
jgi:NitT/TauT family transport system permease protein